LGLGGKFGKIEEIKKKRSLLCSHPGYKRTKQANHCWGLLSALGKM